MDPHHHHPCHLIHPTTTAATCCHHCCHTPPPPSPPPPPHFYSPTLTPPPYQPPHPHHLVNFPNYPYNHQQVHQTPIEPYHQATISSLLRRIAALESSLCRRFPAPQHSLRDAAARTIQTHFRAFLVRRSRTLRELKTLASIKSSLNALKISVSDSAHVDSRAVSRKAVDLLLKIDSIQGGDSMTRDSKRLISRDLDQFLGSFGLSAKRYKLSGIGLKNSKSRVLYNGLPIGTADFVRSMKDERGSKERMRARVETSKGFYRVPDDHDDEADIIELENFRMLNNGKIDSLPKRNAGLATRYGGNQGKAKKNVSFAEDGDLSRVFVSTREPNASEDGLVDEEGELMDNLSRRIQKIAVVSKGNGDGDQDAYSEDEESSQTSSGDENSKRDSKAEGNYQGDDVDFVFSVPMPVKMESRSDLMKTRKA